MSDPQYAPNLQHEQSTQADTNNKADAKWGSEWNSKNNNDSNTNSQDLWDPYVKSWQMMWQVQRKWTEWIQEISNLNQEFSWEMIRNMQSWMPDNNAQDQSSWSQNPEKSKEFMTCAVQFSEKFANQWQKACNDISNEVRHYHEEMTNHASKWPNK